MRMSGLLGRAVTAIAVLFAPFAISGVSLAEPAGEAGSGPVLQAGDLAVTGFSGTILATDKLPPGVDPVDRTVIDPAGPALRVFDASNLNGATAGQRVQAPVRLDVPAKDIGQVFALAVDPGTKGGPPRLFAAATSAFGLNIVGAPGADGTPVRLKAGASDATFMEGQFGALASHSPGAIYEIDAATGAVTYLADTAFSGAPNSGPGIGGLAYDPASNTLYASDLDSGLVHRFALDDNAADLAQYDHGTAGRRANGLPEVADDGRRVDLLSDAFKPEDPGTWGITQPPRRVDALAVHDGRLYYAVAEGPEIWSVGLDATGAFRDDARREVAVKAEKPFPVTAITFDASGHMLLAQRGAVRSPYDFDSFAEPGAQVLRYAPKAPDDAAPDLWKSDPESYAVGTADKGNAASGGVSIQYDYKPDGAIDLGTCEGPAVFTGDTLDKTARGVQMNGRELVRPQNDPPSQSLYIAYDGETQDQTARGHVGSVAAVKACGADAGFPLIDEGGGEGLPPVDEGGAGGGAFPPVEDGGGGETLPPVDDSGGETFPEIDEGGGGETTEANGVAITKSAVPGTCTEKGGCAFNIDITNKSGKALPEIVVSDEMTAGAANLGGAKIEGAPPAPWTCTAPPKMTCKHPGPIADGATVSLPLSFAPTGIGQEKELKNCATLQPGGADQGGGKGNPVALPQATTSEEKGLRFEQVPVTQPCTAGQACEWELRVTNKNATPVTGALQWHTEFDFVQGETKARATGVTIESVSAAPSAACSPVANNDLRQMTCAVDLVTIGANQTFSVKMKVKADAPPNGPSAALQTTAFASFFHANQDQTTGKTSSAVELASPGQAGDQGKGGKGGAAGPVCASLPVTANPDGGGDKAQAQLTIEKIAAVTSCSALGGGCRFKILVKNPGPGDVDGEIVIGEDATLLDQHAGMDVTPMSPGWTCKFDKQGGGNCSHPGPLKAGAPPLELIVDLKPTQATQAASIRNCATLSGTAKKACSEIPLLKDKKPLLRPTKQLVSGTCAPECEFLITVQNVGEGVSTEDFVVREEAMKMPSVANAPMVPLKAEYSVISLDKGFTCADGDAKACKFSGTVKPGEAVNIRIKMVAIDRTFVGVNCASVAAQHPDNEQTGERCVEIRRDGKNEKAFPNLAIEKRGVGPAVGGDFHCELKKECLYIITVKNTGTADYVGPIKITDTVTLGVPEVIEHGPFGNIGWNCTTARNGKGSIASITSIDCTIPGAPDPLKQGNFLPLAPGKQIELGLSVKPGSTWQGSNFLNNCAELVADGKDIGPQKKDKVACARAKLDPFKLKIAKTGDQSCRPGGECRFDLDIFNDEQIVHDDPVTVVDKLSGLSSAEIVSITPVGNAQAFPCQPQPTRIPFTCSGHMRLKPGDHNHYTMVVRLPADASAAAFSNCASVSDARSSDAQATDCHGVRIAPPEKARTCPSERPIGTYPDCCPRGTHFAAGACRGHIDTPLPPPPPRLCEGRRPVGTYPNCCPLGMHFERGACRPDAPPPPSVCEGRRPVGTYPNCCPLGMHFEDGACRRDRPPRPTVSEGRRPVGTYPNCCPLGMHFENGACRRDKPRGDDTTTPSTPTGVCKGHRPVGIYPNCCPRGMHFENGACRRDKPRGDDTTTPSTTGVCKGHRPVGTYPNCCPRGMQFENGACRRKCPSGTHASRSGQCVQDASPNDGPKTEPSKRRCSGGRVGIPPHCYCRGGRKFIGGQCRFGPRPRPHKKNDDIIVK